MRPDSDSRTNESKALSAKKLADAYLKEGKLFDAATWYRVASDYYFEAAKEQAVVCNGQ